MVIILSINKPIIFQNIINFKTVFNDLAQQCVTTCSSQIVKKIIFSKYGPIKIIKPNN